MTKAEEKAETVLEAVAATARALAIVNGHPDPEGYVAKVQHAHLTGEVPPEETEESAAGE